MKKTNPILEVAYAIAERFRGSVIGSETCPAVVTNLPRVPILKLFPDYGRAIRLRLEEGIEAISYVILPEEADEQFIRELQYVIRVRNHVPAILEPKRGTPWLRFSEKAWNLRENPDSNVVTNANR